MRNLGDNFDKALGAREAKHYLPIDNEDRKRLEFAAEDAVVSILEKHEGEDEEFSIGKEMQKNVIRRLIEKGELNESKELPANKFVGKLFKFFEWKVKNKTTIDKLNETSEELKEGISSSGRGRRKTN